MTREHVDCVASALGLPQITGIMNDPLLIGCCVTKKVWWWDADRQARDNGSRVLSRPSVLGDFGVGALY